LEYPRLALDIRLWKWLGRGGSHLWKRLAKPRHLFLETAILNNVTVYILYHIQAVKSH